ncbi:cation diffusion facilitator family transporter [Microcella alkalica]|uniref:cation diffusion facilitator family transporter n=1 Tax=Microcella alkalica TaxID=355930 RepID=UPI002948B85D|nr:cation diffusion facilitator family transporter [Microcella alkalica]
MTGHAHAHSPRGGNRRRLAIAFGLTACILVAQVIGAIITGSLALLVDAAHMLTDAGGLLIALMAAGLMKRAATTRRTWGLLRVEVLAATVQAAVLLGVGIVVVVEAVQRLREPAEIPGAELLVFGVIGLVANAISILVLAGGRAANLNMRAAFLEVLNDALGSLAVIAAAIVIMTTGFQQADSLAALLVGALIIPRTLRLLRDAVDVLLESVPRGIDIADVRRHLMEEEHVLDVHDLHISQIATGLPVLTAHVIVESECFVDGHAPEITRALQACVAQHFSVSIDHATFQLEPAGAERSHDLH